MSVSGVLDTMLPENVVEVVPRITFIPGLSTSNTKGRLPPITRLPRLGTSVLAVTLTLAPLGLIAGVVDWIKPLFITRRSLASVRFPPPLPDAVTCDRSSVTLPLLMLIEPLLPWPVRLEMLLASRNNSLFALTVIALAAALPVELDPIWLLLSVMVGALMFNAVPAIELLVVAAKIEPALLSMLVKTLLLADETGTVAKFSMLILPLLVTAKLSVALMLMLPGCPEELAAAVPTMPLDPSTIILVAVMPMDPAVPVE